MPVRRFWWITGLAVAVGVGLRWFYVLSATRGVPLVGDAETFHLLGRLLADGEGYVRPLEFLDTGVVIPTAEFPPLWPGILGLLDLVGIDRPTGQRMVAGLVGGAGVVTVGLLGRAVAGPVVGAVAAWFAAIYPQFVVYGGSLLSEGVYLVLVTLVVLGVVRARAEDDERIARRWWIVVSVATGAAVMTRSDAVLLVPFLLLPATGAGGDRRRWLQRAALACAGTALVVGAWTIRNAVSLDGFVPLTNNSGTALAGSNCDAVYGGDQIGGWRLDCVPESDYGRLGEIEVARINRDAGLTYVGDHLGEVPAVVAARVGRTFGLWNVRSAIEFGSLEDPDGDWLWWAWYGWLVVAPLAVGGAVVLHRRGHDLWPLLAPAAMVVVISVVTYGNQRFRVAAEPSLVVLAASGGVAGFQRLTGREVSLRTQAPGGSTENASPG